MQGIKENDRKKQIAVLAVIVVLYMLFAFNICHKFIAQGVVENLNTEKLTVTRQLQEGDEIIQKIQPKKSNLSAVKLLFATYANSKNGMGNLKLQLIDYDTEEVLAESDLNTELLYDQMEYLFEFDEVDVTDKSPAVVIKAEELSEEATISLYLGELSEQVKEECVYNGTAIENPLRMDYAFIEIGYMEKIIIISLVIMFALIVAVYVLLVMKKAKIHQIYLMAILILGLIYMLLLPEFATPDEGTHIQKAIQLSNSVLDYDNSTDNFEMRECEAELFGVDLSKMNRNSYEYYYDTLLNGDNSDERVGKAYEPITTPKYQYFLTASGITIGRLMDLNGLQTFLIGMLLNFAFYVVVTYFAIKIIPFGKVTAAIICLLPISIQQATSYSYDCMLIAVSTMFLAAFLKVVHDKNCKKYYYVILTVSTLMFLPTKQLAYIAILLLVGYAVFGKVKGKLSKKTWLMIAGSTAGIVLVSVIAFLFLRSNASGTEEVTSTVPFVEWVSQPGYTIGALLAEPLDTIDMFWNTLYAQGEFYFLSTFGGKLGWLNINVSIFAVCVYLTTAIIAVMPSSGEAAIKMKGSTRILLFLVFLISVGCAMAGMLLGWTSIAMNYIQGVQGRYFLPVLLMAFFALRSNEIRITERLERSCFMTAIAFQALTIAGVLYSM